jgi:hypothetical protein
MGPAFPTEIARIERPVDRLMALAFAYPQDIGLVFRSFPRKRESRA